MSDDGVQWDETLQLPYFDYKTNGSQFRHRVEYHNSQSILLRAVVVRAAGLHGVGAWSMATVDVVSHPEDAELWDGLLDNNNDDSPTGRVLPGG